MASKTMRFHAAQNNHKPQPKKGGKDFITFVISSGWKHFILADKLDPESSWFSGWGMGTSKGTETHVGDMSSPPVPVVWAVFL